MSALNPSVGRIVFFHQDGGPYPAIITKVVHDGTRVTVDLVTFGSQSVYFQLGVPQAHGDEPANGQWSWPPRV
jgi:hypothetical protein